MASGGSTARWWVTRDGHLAMFVRTALLVLRKDVAIEVRSFEIVSTTLFFAISNLLLYSSVATLRA